MTVEPRDDLVALEGYHSPQVEVDVRLNTNEAARHERYEKALRRLLAKLPAEFADDRDVRYLKSQEDRGAVTGLATTTRGLGLLIGPLAVGAAIDIFKPFLEETDGYAAVWPAVAIPVLAVIPIVTLLADEENRRRGIRGRGLRRSG